MGKSHPHRFQVAGRGTPREINRRILLNIVRSRQPLSRADLARIMGTRRAAVSLIVNDLITEGLLYEGAKGETARGRKPQFLYIDSRKRWVFAVDLRPTRTYVMVSDLLGNSLIGVTSFPTDSGRRAPRQNARRPHRPDARGASGAGRVPGRGCRRAGHGRAGRRAGALRAPSRMAQRRPQGGAVRGHAASCHRGELRSRVCARAPFGHARRSAGGRGNRLRQRLGRRRRRHCCTRRAAARPPQRRGRVRSPAAEHRRAAVRVRGGGLLGGCTSPTWRRCPGTSAASCRRTNRFRTSSPPSPWRT